MVTNLNNLAKVAKKKSSYNSPYVDRLASRLVQSITENDITLDATSHSLLEEVFSFAAEAEKNLIIQEDRITLLEDLSSTDDLTGLANRRGLDQFLDEAIARASRTGLRGIIGFFDLDWFKDINDTMGHEAGDAVLVHIAKILKRNIRGGDLAARFGGDEFVVLLDGANKDLGTIRLKLIRDEINNKPCNYKGFPIPLHTSLGLSFFSSTSDAKKVLADADRAMYEQKRNRPKITRQ